jgi:predicted membrane protein
MGCLIGLILLGIGIFVAYKMIPVKVRAAEVRQVVEDEAKSAGSHEDERIKAAIVAKAKDDDLPLTEDDIKIVRHAGEITVDVNYTVPIQFPGYIYQWHISHHVQNPIF